MLIFNIQVRKEVFTPTERLEAGLAMNLVFAQIVQDVHSISCMRISKDDRMRMRSMLGQIHDILYFIMSLPECGKTYSDLFLN